MDQLVAGPHMEVVGIGKLHLRADRAQVIGRNRALDGRHRADIHENRRLDGSVHGFHFSAFLRGHPLYKILYSIFFPILFTSLPLPSCQPVLAFFSMRFFYSAHTRQQPDTHTDEYVPQIETYHQRKSKLTDGRYTQDVKNQDHDEGRQRRVDASRQGLADTGVDDRLSGLFVAQKLHILTDTVEDDDRRVDRSNLQS